LALQNVIFVAVEKFRRYV